MLVGCFTYALSSACANALINVPNYGDQFDAFSDPPEREASAADGPSTERAHCASSRRHTPIWCCTRSECSWGTGFGGIFDSIDCSTIAGPERREKGRTVYSFSPCGRQAALSYPRQFGLTCLNRLQVLRVDVCAPRQLGRGVGSLQLGALPRASTNIGGLDCSGGGLIERKRERGMKEK